MRNQDKIIVNSHNIEFGYELISVIPYAYYLQSKGLLEKTISGNDTECLYYFSPNHEINSQPRSWYNTKNCTTPNIKIHKDYLDKSQFLAPDYKSRFANDRFKFDKEIVVICNRVNVEWSVRPINFFDLPTLKAMFELLQDEYQIIYINVEGRPELYDNENPISIGDYQLLKSYPKCINIHDLHKSNSDLTFNELQLMIFANCQKYITMNGGHAILSAFFGGENILMSKRGKPEARELHHSVNSFYRWYHELGGQRVIHVDNETLLLERIKMQWIDKQPVVNVLVRTSERPKYFEICIKSILEQTYKNVNIWVAIDSVHDYTVKYPVYPVHVKKQKNIPVIENDENYGVPFPQNLFLNELQAKVKSGLIIYLDDDDKFTHNTSIELIVNSYLQGNQLIFWNVRSNKRTIPTSENFGKAPVCCDISGIGFAFDAKYKFLAEWEPYKRGDYRVATKLYNNIENREFINLVLTQTQNGQHYGAKTDLLKFEPMEKIKVEIVRLRNTRHGKSKYSIGQVLEVDGAVAKQLLAHKIAKIWQPEIKKVEQVVDHNRPIEVIEEPVLIEKEQESKPKKGRKSKK